MGMKKKTLVFAHRGTKRTHPENTMAAFKEAERIQADGIELDVHLSKDGEVVIIHDETLDRTTTLSGYVKDFTLQQLKQADAGVTFDSSFAGETIPTLREVFEWAAQNQLLINVELKNDEILYEGLEEKVVALIREYQLEDRIILSSFSHASIEKLKQLASDIERALLYFELPSSIIEMLAEKQEAGFHPNTIGLTKDTVVKAQQLGYTVRPYVANTIEDMKHMIEYGVDAIMSDYPNDVINVLKDSKLTQN
jgi:glycerophosphoryl diester phosphodiesterase